MNIKIYDCENFASNVYPPIRGKLVSEFINNTEILHCDFISVGDKAHAIFIKSYNLTDGSYEVWVKGNVVI